MDTQFAIGLPISTTAVKIGAMARQNKTEQVLLRVRPETKQRYKMIADATGKNVTEMVEAAVELYAKQKDVREALADAAKASKPEGEG